MAVERMCAVCRNRSEKQNLIRITKNSAGEISLDKEGKLPGRGMYICKDGDCLKLAKKRKAVERSFKISAAAADAVYSDLEEI